MSCHSAAARATEILLGTSEGLIAVDSRFRKGKFLTRDGVTCVAWDESAGRWVAGGKRGVWREDLGWFYPSRPADGADVDAWVGGPEIQSIVSSPGGLLISSEHDLWRMGADSAPAHLLSDSAGLFGRPASSATEDAVIGFWSLHRISRGPGGPGVTDIPLPPEARADLPLGVAYVGHTLLAIFQRTGIYVLTPGDRTFPDAILPPATDASHLEQGFGDGWADFAADGDDVYLLSSDAKLYRLSIGQPLRKISRWPDLAEPCRFSILPGRRFLLYPSRGNSIFVADASMSNPPDKINFLVTSSGEVLLRPGLVPASFTYRSKFERLRNAAVWAIVVFGFCAAGAWSILNGIPGLYRLHPSAGVFYDRLTKFQRDQSSLLQSFYHTEKELHRMRAPASALETMDAEFRKNYEDRLRVFTENLSALKENMRRFAQKASEEAHRIKTEGAHGRSAADRDRPGLLTRLLRTQTRGWERRFLRIAREVERALAEGADV